MCTISKLRTLSRQHLNASFESARQTLAVNVDFPARQQQQQP